MKSLNQPRLLVVALLALCLPLGSGCQLTKEPEPNWRTAEVRVASDRILWKITLLALGKLDYPLTAGLDPSTMKVETGWRNSLAPFSREGYRSKATVELLPVSSGTWSVRTRIRKEINKTLVKPLDLSYAEWEEVPDDEIEAQVLLQHIRSLLDTPIELSEDPNDPIDAYLKARGLDDPR